MVTRRPRLLIKAQPVPAGTRMAAGAVDFHLQPLFPRRPGRTAMGAAAPAEWHVADAPEGSGEADLWDLCHQIQTGGMGLTGAAVSYAEPDLEQRWMVDTPQGAAARAFRASESCEKPEPAAGGFPFPKPFDWRWHLDDAHSGLGAARALIGTPKDPVTIAHLDTGYRKGHSILPANLDFAAQRSFVEGDANPNSAEDPGVDGFGNNPGHGTGTLGILAGSRFDGTPFGAPSDFVGGAPFARVIPVRVANSVVLFTNSSIAQGLRYAIDQGVDVVSMSMGGVPSQLWAELVNEAYDAGITIVTAAGNNFGPFKLRVPRFIVYPARFRRVLAACGVMWNGKPYADFADPRKMGGSYGPDSKMDTAMAAYTPNTPWAKYACPAIVDFDGAGTSSATPQIAAAAACWLQKNRAALKKYPEKWMRVEAVRQALFAAAAAGDREHLGRGTLRARDAMDIVPAAASLAKQAEDGVGVPVIEPVFDVLFGAAKAGRREQMLRLETAQIFARSGELQRILVDAGVDPDRPAGALPASVRQRLLEALQEDTTASKSLRAALGRPARRDRVAVPGAAPVLGPSAGETVAVPAPAARSLRVFAFDPVLRLRLETERINQATLDVRWETDLQPGPVGEYLEVIDVDPASGACYAPVDLNHPHVLAADGLAPSEGVPQFHQQMVYAVAMTTIQRFEDALGRTAMWAPRFAGAGGEFVQRLRIYPHALREANAYYSPEKIALLFGYFQALPEGAGDNLPGGMVFNCLSHDVIAHETTHALVDGLHRYYRHETNDDIAAFHEAFADIVALFQHFSIPAALRHVIVRTRGDLRKDNLLAELAQQFGQASFGSRALRSALGKPPKQTDYAEATEAHDRGAVLLGAVFQAFLEIYEARVEDLKRLATGGTGVLPEGAIPVDLVNRMAAEAAKAAERVLTACIRALDYCPPVDLTFGDYLRALITADMDLEPEDEFNYRTAFISGFRARGIFPDGVLNFSEESLRWQPPRFEFDTARIRAMVQDLDLRWDLTLNREEAYYRAEENGKTLLGWLRKLGADEAAAIQQDLGVYTHIGPDLPAGVRVKNGVPVLEIHSVRPARRIGSRNQHLTDLVVEAVQKFEAKDPETGEVTTHRGGCTILIDLQNYRIRYAIRKRVASEARVRKEQNFRRMAARPDYFGGGIKEPFAMLHRGMAGGRTEEETGEPAETPRHAHAGGGN